jgi:hypothetical protein
MRRVKIQLRFEIKVNRGHSVTCNLIITKAYDSKDILNKLKLHSSTIQVIVLSVVPIMIGFAIAYFGIYNACCTAKYDKKMDAVLSEGLRLIPIE